MRTDIITIGDEILIGQIVDTNSAWMSSKVVENGGQIQRIVTVPDRIPSIMEAIREAESRSELILITGGLGPTRDDLTKEALCTYFNCELEFRPDVLEHLEKLYASRNRPLNAGNRSQAYLPALSETLPNELGTAPGMRFRMNGKIYVSMPGVPYEMKDLMKRFVLPELRNRASSELLRHCTTVIANIPESTLSERLADFESALPDHVKLAYLPHMNLVRLRLTAKGADEQKLEEILRHYQDVLCTILGGAAIARADMNMGQILGEALTTRNETMGIAESCTGGYASHLITQNPGSSRYFPGSMVTYSYDVKTSQLGVNSDTLWTVGAVSEEVVRTMAENVMHRLGTDYGLAISGIAGPDGATKDKPVGTVWMAVANRSSTFAKCYHLKGNRLQNIERSSLLGLEFLRKLICNELSATADQ
ncbi:MAG: CinA family nicotinamide mononucleotide deamidase-related protein [Flavobacteriales bacterium]|nr:CinA family nicotinamide mononucleotide deamidase-related protein [Flavobacteriales bacterium]